MWAPLVGRRYVVGVSIADLTPGTGAQSFLTLTCEIGKPFARIYKIGVIREQVAAGSGVVIGIRRCTYESGGSALSQTPIFRKDTQQSGFGPDLRIRTGTITISNAGSIGLIFGNTEVVTANTSGPQSVWTAIDYLDAILLRPGETVAFQRAGTLTFDPDDRAAIYIEWDEEYP